MATCREEKNHYLRKALRVLSLGRKTLTNKERREQRRRKTGTLTTPRTLQADVDVGDTLTLSLTEFDRREDAF